MYVIVNVWKEVGWGTIIYLAALTSIDESLYEAAYLDGATRFQRVVYITLPLIRSTVVTMLLLTVSKMMSIGLDAPLLWEIRQLWMFHKLSLLTFMNLVF